MAPTTGSSRSIGFSPPDIGEAEIARVCDVLRSGWITTGPATKEFEQQLASYTQAAGVACLSSATTSLECVLHILGIGPGDQVIAPAYTYTASVSPIAHVGATPLLCDVKPGTVQLDTAHLARLVGPRTKAIVGVDIGGVMEDYSALVDVAQSATSWCASNAVQESLGRIAVIADAAHSLGSSRAGKTSGTAADFSVFSFHAVKNLTTGEGGALCWRPGWADDEQLYRQAMLYCLHGQTKDALSKQQAGGWEYDVAFLGHKCNMTDIQAALGLAQLERFDALLARRRSMVERYERNLQGSDVWVMPHFTQDAASSAHLMITRVARVDADARNRIIESMAQRGVACNVHYKPLPMLSAYRGLGFDIARYPNALAFYENEITLPLHTLLSDDDIDYVCACYLEAIEQCR